MKAQYKIQLPDTPWKDSPIIAEFEIHAPNIEAATPSAKIHGIEIAYAVDREVRWNWEGSRQGHYVGSVYRYNVELAEAEAEV